MIIGKGDVEGASAIFIIVSLRLAPGLAIRARSSFDVSRPWTVLGEITLHIEEQVGMQREANGKQGVEVTQDRRKGSGRSSNVRLTPACAVFADCIALSW